MTAGWLLARRAPNRSATAALAALFAAMCLTLGGCGETAVPRFECAEDLSFDPANAAPMRFHVVDELIRDHLDNPIRLRGANLKGINDDEARVLAKDIKMNFARLRISFESPNRDDGDPSGSGHPSRRERQ
jgi:hypothetical protein